MPRIQNRFQFPIFVEPNGLALPRGLLSIAVASGKGGAGKTNVVANLGFAFTQLQKKVLILDGNLGLSNIGGLLGLTNSYNIEHVLNKRKTIFEVLLKGPGGMLILPASSCNEKLVNPSSDEKIFILEELKQIAHRMDFLLIDTASGISQNVMFFNSIAMESIVVTTPEFTSVSTAFSLIKILATKYQKKRFKILVNIVKNEKEAKEIFKMILRLGDSCLGSVSLDYLGFIPFDKRLKQAVERQKLVADIYPHASSSQRFKEIAASFIESQEQSIFKSLVPKIAS